MSDTSKLGESRLQKGGNNGVPVNPKPQNIRPAPPSPGTTNPSKK